MRHVITGCVGVGLVLAAVPAFGQVTGRLASDPDRSLAALEVQATVQTLFLFFGQGRAATSVTGGVDVEFIPDVAPFAFVDAENFSFDADDARMTILLDDNSPFIPPIPVEVTLSDLRVESTEPAFGDVDANATVTFFAAPIRITARISVNAGLLGIFEMAFDQSTTTDVSGTLTDDGVVTELMLTTLVSRDIEIPPEELPPAISRAALTITLDLTRVVLTGELDRNRTPGDSDGDRDVDLADFLAFLDCLMSTAGVPIPAACTVFDFDEDGDIDLADYVTFQTVFTGSN